MIEEDTARITERIEEFRRHLGLNKSDFCKLIAFPLGTYSNITGSRQSKPNAELLAAIATHTQVNPHWLLTGEGGMLAAMARPAESGSEGGAPAMFTPQELADQYVLVPFYDVRGSAGGGSYVNDVEVIDRLAFRAEWIYRELRVRPEDLALISADGLTYQFLERLKDLNIRTVEITPEDNPWIINGLAVRPGRVVMPPGISDRTRDALGKRRVKLDWRLTRFDSVSVRRSLVILNQELGRALKGRVQLLQSDAAPWPGAWGPHHQMGTTRIHVDPTKGVVDPDCRGHSVSNLYVAGSSVFPTSGFANPTYTLVALALRPADHLKDRMRT
ncbi:MAG: hypothetical protein IIA40_05310 [SAR324 cluster bacterium]|nr:hypothetical protein [SAR324 cluster bacterium]